MEFVHLGGSWKGTTIAGSWTWDWCQSELHLVLSSSLVLCPSAGLRALSGGGQSLEWHVPLWSCSLDPVCMAEPGLACTVPPLPSMKPALPSLLSFFPASPRNLQWKSSYIN